MDGQAKAMAREKAAWRERFRAARAAMPAAERQQASAAIVAGVLALPEAAHARTVSVFWPMLARGEVDMRPLIHALAARGATVALPVVDSRPGEPPRLLHRAFAGEAALVTTAWGLREPAPGAPLVEPGALDLVVVPGFGMARSGHRIGHGGGFYDAFLATCPGLRVGVVYDACVAEHLPHGAHDVPVEVVVTERQTWRVEAPSPHDEPGAS
jgi:5-formyltetrahydrofolate cyclo-ligase